MQCDEDEPRDVVVMMDDELQGVIEHPCNHEWEFISDYLVKCDKCGQTEEFLHA